MIIESNHLTNLHDPMFNHGGHMSTPGPCLLNPATPAGYAELLIRNRIDRALTRTTTARNGGSPSDLGASVIEWVIISAMLMAIAVIIGGILLNSLRTKANTINLDTTLP